ncbi:MAG: hypothetical protein JNL09_10470, partial [Anaerolineales bacterium]|nr:hypothetical protein [Anaerolineales bacterium]
YGLPMAAGLWFIGVPGAILWGVLAAIMRFVPYVGAMISAAFPLALAFAVSWFVFSRWTAGYEWRITGQNSLFARLGGVKTEENYMTVMLVTGALAGLAGGLIVMAGPHRFLRGLGANYAWDGIMIAVVANNGLIATVLYGLFFAAMQTGALGMELITAVPSEFILVIQAIVVLVVVASRGRLSEWLEALLVSRRAPIRQSSNSPNSSGVEN